MTHHKFHTRHGPLLTAGALAFALAAAPATAQAMPARNDAAVGASNAAGEEVHVTSQHEPGVRDEFRSMLKTVSLSQAVRYDDLNLATRQGAHRLRVRVRRTAHELCRELKYRYPITVDMTPRCYSRAVDHAMDQADAAIDNARDRYRAD